LKLGSRSLWLEDDVDKFIACLVSERDARAAAKAGREATTVISQAARGASA
jgi:hypothetical protein